MRRWGILWLACFATVLCYGQRLRPDNVGTAKPIRRDTSGNLNKDRWNHYLGLQANQLFNQLFNFGGTLPAIANPYLLIYSTNAPSGWGINTGIGYNRNTIDSSNPANTNTSSIVSFSYRVGFEKKSFLGKKWLASYGLDLLWGKEDDDTKSSFQSQFNTNSTEIVSSITYSGFGPRTSLSFFVTERILLGTEATYYFRFLSNSQKTTNFNSNTTVDPITQIPTTQVSTSTNGTSQRTSDYTLNLPVVLFLNVKF